MDFNGNRLILFCFKLFEHQRHSEKGRERYLFYWFTSQMSTKARADPGTELGDRNWMQVYCICGSKPTMLGSLPPLWLCLRRKLQPGIIDGVESRASNVRQRHLHCYAQCTTDFELKSVSTPTCYLYGISHLICRPSVFPSIKRRY